MGTITKNTWTYSTVALFLRKLEAEQSLAGGVSLASEEQEVGRTGDLPQGFLHPDLAILPPHTQVNVKNSVEELVKALLKQARTDLEKVRAIWMWICHHIGRLRSPAEDKAVAVTSVPLPWQFTHYLWVISMWGVE